MTVLVNLVFPIKPEKIDSFLAMMSETLKLSIPLEVDVGIGLNWQEAH